MRCGTVRVFHEAARGVGERRHACPPCGMAASREGWKVRDCAGELSSGCLCLFDDTERTPQWNMLNRSRHAHLERPPCAVVPVRQRGHDGVAPHGLCSMATSRVLHGGVEIGTLVVQYSWGEVAS